MIGICTDSSSQLPAELVDHLGVEIVPVTVTIDGVEYLDGVDLDADGFYSRFTADTAPEVSMSEPSPGQFAAAYEDLIARGCTEILSIHVAPTVAGAVNAARLAAHATAIPVRVVDSTSVGFGVGCCVWAAADAVRHGATLEQAAVASEQAASTLGHFVLLHPSHTDASMVLVNVTSGSAAALGTFPHAADAIDEMARRAVACGQRLRVGVGHSDASSLPTADALAAALGEVANVFEVVRFRIGPSMGSLTGPGAVGCVVSGTG